MEQERHGEAFEGDIKLTVIGKQLREGEPAPPFSLDTFDAGDPMPHPVSLADGAGRVRLLHVVNSLDTPVCHVGAHRFEQMAATLPPNVDVYTVSMDLRSPSCVGERPRVCPTGRCRAIGARSSVARMACCCASGASSSGRCSSLTAVVA
jgi:hypothetical protein